MSRAVQQDFPRTSARPGGEGAGSLHQQVARPPLAHSGGRQRRIGLTPAIVLAGCFAGIALLYASSQAVTGGGVSHRWESAPLLVLSLIATTTYLVVFVALHLLPTGYRPVDHAVSDYGVGRYAGLFRLGLYASSLGVLALAFGLMRGVGSPPLAARDLLYLLLIPVARIGMSIMPTALEGQRLGRTGRLHYVFAIAAFTFTYLLVSGTTSMLRASDPTSWSRGPLGWIAWAVAPELALVVVTMMGPLRRVFGLVERLFLLTTNVWFILVALLVLGRMN